MTPDEVLQELKCKYGVSMSRSTLTRYENKGLIPKPKHGAYGRGKGRFTDYLNSTVNDLYKAVYKKRLERL